MALGHERLDVSRLAIADVAWVYEMLSRLGGRGYPARESEEVYSAEGAKDDPDPDSDFDSEIVSAGRSWKRQDTFPRRDCSQLRQKGAIANCMIGQDDAVMEK
jgi:hypothetical protein